MIFFTLLLMLLQLVAAAPLQSRQTAPASASGSHPALEELGDVAAKLQMVIREVDRFSGGQRAADVLVRDSMEAIDILHSAIKQVEQGPDIGYIQALTFIPVATNLITNAFSLVKSVKAKSAVLAQTDETRTYQVLDQCYHAVSMLVQAFDKKLPSGVAVIMRGVNGSVVQTLKESRDQFKTPVTQTPTESSIPPPTVQEPDEQQEAKPTWPQQQSQPSYSPPGWQGAPQGQTQPRPQSQTQPQFAPYPPPPQQVPGVGQGQGQGEGSGSYQYSQNQPQYAPWPSQGQQGAGFGQGQGQGLGSEQLSESQPKYVPYPGIPVAPSEQQGWGPVQNSQLPSWFKSQQQAWQPQPSQ